MESLLVVSLQDFAVLILRANSRGKSQLGHSGTVIIGLVKKSSKQSVGVFLGSPVLLNRALRPLIFSEFAIFNYGGITLRSKFILLFVVYAPSFDATLVGFKMVWALLWLVVASMFVSKTILIDLDSFFCKAYLYASLLILRRCRLLKVDFLPVRFWSSEDADYMRCTFISCTGPLQTTYLRFFALFLCFRTLFFTGSVTANRSNYFIKSLIVSSDYNY